ncbi:hypothetical protein M409DRAFT_20868 [Zasmidium cellare ATCC 36951]|uniref:Ubiquitin-like domain-containing protein n=1 Tax=Zasmidium cellare ATCC 36951 TaxID=1080233 RepID=A0A6A6CP24_ZASCE|nr:uncharacterized protein M409DRAFT_20868 [Zasmidium cellare ATCC 36951]KAF2168855.1 hypothetical protein M409DRAFT_20868 [Zasmidium cellare ATCC 36951]
MARAEAEIISGRPTVRIYIQLVMMSERFALGIPLSTIIAQLRVFARKRTGVAPETQRLICRGKQLEDHRTLNDYCCYGDDEIHVLLRLMGS